jgi:hypothetical protein
VPNGLVAGMPTGQGEKEKEKPIGAWLHGLMFQFGLVRRRKLKIAFWILIHRKGDSNQWVSNNFKLNLNWSQTKINLNKLFEGFTNLELFKISLNIQIQTKA